MNSNPSRQSSLSNKTGQPAIHSRKLNVKEISNTPLILFQPFNIIVFLSFFSPIIIATIVTATSFMSQNVNGFIYLGFLLACVVIRSYIYMISGSSEIIKNDGSICTSIQYSKYGNPSFSSFVIAFTIMYLCLPMFVNNNINYYILAILIIYFLVDVFIKVSKKCISSLPDLTLNVLFGLFSAAMIITLMYSGGSGKYLFFDQSSKSYNSDTQCSMPSKQTFKCAVYKNGQLVNSTTTSS